MADKDPERSRVIAWGLGSVVASRTALHGVPRRLRARCRMRRILLTTWCYRFGAGGWRGPIRGTPLTAARLRRYAGAKAHFGNGNPALRPSRHGERQLEQLEPEMTDRKSTRLNSSHLVISYAVFCLKKKKKKEHKVQENIIISTKA